ncbi:MAG TPA: GC-type dockerin domain-anchored protein [Phycisphaerales bacterium]|nr:GC-type dockerin domain-anchored protein [Phycisphaerales bacterium]
MHASVTLRSTPARRGHLFRTIAVAVLPVLAAAAGAIADPVLVTTNTTLASADTLFPGTTVPVASAEVTVQNATLTINGDVTITSLTVATGGVVTHAQGFAYDADPGPGVQMVGGFHLYTSTFVTVNANGLIDVGGRGHDGGQGPGAGVAAVVTNECAGGGGYGGSGGAGAVAGGGGTYGSFSQPTDLGSGGGASDTVAGKRGGGAIRLTVGGTLTVNGEIAADGDPYNGTYSGGGSGGSIWITAATVTGTGTIHANGRGYNACATGGGGGGRVAVYSCNMTMPVSTIVAHGVSGSGEGTVYFNATAVAVVAQIVSAGNRCPGATVALTAETINATSYQWRRNNVPMLDGPGIGGTTYSGVSSQTLTVTNVSPIDGAAEITCLVNNACGLVTSTPAIHLICAGDFNCSGTLSVQDIFDFLNAWFAADPRADFNGGGLAVQDIFDFLNAWFAGCL